MGNGIGIKCLACGHEWNRLTGTGIHGKPAGGNADTATALTPSGEKVTVLRCPMCGSTETEMTHMILWD